MLKHSLLLRLLMLRRCVIFEHRDVVIVYMGVLILLNIGEGIMLIVLMVKHVLVWLQWVAFPSHFLVPDRVFSRLGLLQLWQLRRLHLLFHLLLLIVCYILQ